MVQEYGGSASDLNPKWSLLPGGRSPYRNRRQRIAHRPGSWRSAPRGGGRQEAALPRGCWFRTTASRVRLATSPGSIRRAARMVAQRCTGLRDQCSLRSVHGGLDSYKNHSGTGGDSSSRHICRHLDIHCAPGPRSVWARCST